MRITNNVIMRNTKTNINTNKLNVNDMNNQMSSQKKIALPSDDPVIAVRALRLRSNLGELDQYLHTNIEQADSWLDITETAIGNISSLLNKIYDCCVQGANDTLNQQDRNAILAQLKQNRDQIHSEGNTDYAGRTVFTGYKTNAPLTYTDASNDHYQIDQRLSFEDLQENKYIYNEVIAGDISGFASLPNTAYATGNDPGCQTVNRIRLAYDSLTYDPLDTTSQPKIFEVDADGKVTTTPISFTVVTTQQLEEKGYDVKELDGTNGIVLNRETGELLFTDEKANEFKASMTKFQITYDKTGFSKGDLTPEDYFNCRKFDDTKTPPEVDKTYKHIDDKGAWINENINYTVAINQEFAINIEAKDVLNHNIGRDITDLGNTVQAAIDAYDKVAKIEGMLKLDAYAGEEDQAKLKALLERANKEATYADDQMRNLFTKYVGRFQDYINTAELARTDVGARGDRLMMTKNRVEAQFNTVDKLKSQNEDADLSDVVIDYQASYLAYQASLQAASKVQQQTLLDYI
ncbi:MAG: flagellar hook-associated protein FlgL [Lachnospiraceae bacterium]|nr:flagellar hook-associated protein FlgL [Lachnospiraceae bacterium]